MTRRPSPANFLPRKGAPRRELTSARAVARWRRWLATYDRPWPEWAELVVAVSADRFELELVDVPMFPFLLGQPDAMGRRVSVYVTPRSTDALIDELPADGFSPFATRYPWLLSLRRLQRGTHPLMAGGIADLLGARPITKRSRVSWQWGTALDSAMEERRPLVFPRPTLWPFQATENGTALFVDDVDTVHAFAPGADAFEPIGGLEDFVRYCLRRALDGGSWTTDYLAGAGLAEYRLRHVQTY